MDTEARRKFETDQGKSGVFALGLILIFMGGVFFGVAITTLVIWWPL